MRIRKAGTADVRAVHALINDAAKKETMIPRSLNDLFEHLRDILVCEHKGDIQGVCSLHVVWEDLAEVRSLAVKEKFQSKGAGRALLARALKEARGLGVKRVFALTYKPEFFRKLGFSGIDKSKLPHKVWGDCLRCPKFPDCDEEAVIKEL